MKNLVKRFGQFVNEDHHGVKFSPNVRDNNMLPRGEQEDAPEKCEYGCEDFDNDGNCIECGHIDPEHEMNTTRFNRDEDFEEYQIDRHNMSASELSEAKKQEKIEALDAIDKKFAKMKPTKKSMPMKPMTKKNMEMEEEEESSMKPKMLFGKPVKSAKPETKTNKMPLKGGKPAFLFGKK